MECIEARALKSSLLSEIAMKSNQVIFEDMWCVTGINNVGSDDFSVDDLLDLSDKDFNGGESEEDEEKDSLSSVSSQDRVDDDNSNSDTSGDLPSLTAGELAVPVDDLENLEWLSQFVDDSATELSLLCPAATEKPAKFTGTRNEPVTRTGNEPVTGTAVQNFNVLCLPSPVPRKARGKRTKRAGGIWPLGPLSGAEPLSFSQESYSLGSPVMTPAQVMESFFAAWNPPAKKQKKSPAVQNGSMLGGAQVQRRCTHCHVQKTPQWRTGPLGPKTLCNACGVRFKSGRLYPEYRPACSPTFSGDLHSNSHRKVLEMRQRKEMVETSFSPAEAKYSAVEEVQMIAAV